MDDTLYDTEYDVIILGTGMVESIVSGAFARAGMTVLHLDQNDYYGSEYATFTFDRCEEWKNSNIAAISMEPTLEKTVFVDQNVIHIPVVQPLNWKIDCESNTQFNSSNGHFNGKSNLDDDDDDAKVSSIVATDDAKVSSIVATDEARVSSIVATDDARVSSIVATDDDKDQVNQVKKKKEDCLNREDKDKDKDKDGLNKLSSKIGIDLSPRVVLSSDRLVQLLIESGVGHYLEFTTIESLMMYYSSETDEEIMEVPSSKIDVFQSKILNVVEKRTLMKFLQFVADYGEMEIVGADVCTKNERELAKGRSLKRPQNKSTLSVDVNAYLDKPFNELLETKFKLSTKLQKVIYFAIALYGADENSKAYRLTSKEGLFRVHQYLSGLGRFSSSSFLFPLFGVSEIVQSFCRLSAVYGGIFILRAPITSIVINKENTSCLGVRTENGKLLQGKQIIANSSYLPYYTRKTNSQVFRMICILSNILFEDKHRLLLVIPPYTKGIDNPMAIHCIQLDETACVCPNEYCILQLTTTLDDQLSKDKLGMQILDQLSKDKLGMQILDKALESLLLKSTTNTKVLWKLNYVQQLYQLNDQQQLPHNLSLTFSSYQKKQKKDSDQHHDYQHHDHHDHPLQITLAQCTQEAEDIFRKYCPDQEFLPQCQSAQQMVNEEEQEENTYLEAAKSALDNLEI